MVITWDVGIAGGGFTQSATVVFWYKPEPVLFPEEVCSYCIAECGSNRLNKYRLMDPEPDQMVIQSAEYVLETCK